MALNLILNGHGREFPKLNEEATLAETIGELGLQADRVAVEWNGEIVARRDWGATRIHQGDRLEVVHFVGGGC